MLSIDRARDHEEEIEEIVREFYRYVDYSFNHEQIIDEMYPYMTRSGNSPTSGL